MTRSHPPPLEPRLALLPESHGHPAGVAEAPCTTALMATVFVPVMMGLFWRGRKTSLASLLSATLGLGTAVLVYGGPRAMGRFRADWGTYVLDLHLGSLHLEVWQE